MAPEPNSSLTTPIFCAWISTAQADIAALDKNRIQVQIGQGLANYSMLKGSEADVEIDTPNVSVHPVKDGRYRVEVNSDGDSFVTVNEGEAQVSTSEGSTTGSGKANSSPFGERARMRSTKSAKRRPTTIGISGIGIATTSFTTRAPIERRIAITPVPMTWIITAPGAKFPTTVRFGFLESTPTGRPIGMAAGFGSRIMVGLGFRMSPGAGRHITTAGGSLMARSWAWWPGPVYPAYRPIWAPAYVSFFGFGGGVGFGVGFGFGSIGWLPIGPCDFFHPWWGGFRDRFGVVKIRHRRLSRWNRAAARR